MSFAIMMCLTTIFDMIHYDTIRNGSFTKMITDYCNNTNKYGEHGYNYKEFFNSNWGGGFFSEFVYALLCLTTIAIYIVLALIIFIIGLGVIINKKILHIIIHKNFLNKTKDEGETQINLQEGSVAKVNLAVIQHDIMSGEVETPLFDYLIDNGEDNDVINMGFADDCAKKISDVLEQYKISVKKEPKINVMPIFTQIIYNIEDDKVDDVLKLQNDIASKLTITKFVIFVKGNNVIFELINKQPSKVSLKSILKKVGHKDRLPIGEDIDKKPVFLDLEKNHSAIVLGRVGSGIATVLTNLLVSYAYVNNPKQYEIVLISTEKGSKGLINNFGKIPHIKSGVVYGNNNIATFIKKVNSGTYSKDNLLILFDDFSKYTANSNVDRELLIDLIKKANNSSKINVVLFSNVVDNNSAGDDIYNSIKCKYILKTNTQNESIAILNSPQAYSLYGSGDGYYLNPENEKSRIQVCYMGGKELQNIVEIISFFYIELAKK
jgi:DNA segregation ATPase FtsK/SpoIIIE-like protein